MLFGFNGKSHGLTLQETIGGAGSYQVGGAKLVGVFTAGFTYFTGRTLGPPPYYGETFYAGRNIICGFGLNIIPLPPAYAAPLVRGGDLATSPFFGLSGER